jgi:hypothetical protein
MMKLHRLSILIALIASGTAPSAGTASPRMSRIDAQQILLGYLQDARFARRPGFALEWFDSPTNPGFYYFEAVFANPRPGSAILGSWAVDSQTGDIWSATICEEKTSPRAHARQMQIRARLQITPNRYRQLRRGGPICD